MCITWFTVQMCVYMYFLIQSCKSHVCVPVLFPVHDMQCVGRALRGKTDYGIMVFADKV